MAGVSARVSESVEGNGGGEYVLPPGSNMTLPCVSSIHGECAQALRCFGVQQACPLFRAELPPGPDKRFAEATDRYLALERRQQMRGQPWQNMKKADRKKAGEIEASWQRAALEGNAGAQYNLAVLYSKGQGLLRKSFEEAARWYRKAADQGNFNAQLN